MGLACGGVCLFDNRIPRAIIVPGEPGLYQLQIHIGLTHIHLAEIAPVAVGVLNVYADVLALSEPAEHGARFF